MDIRGPTSKGKEGRDDPPDFELATGLLVVFTIPSDN